MRRVPRHLFVPDEQARYAYDDHPLPIGGPDEVASIGRAVEDMRLQLRARVVEAVTRGMADRPDGMDDLVAECLSRPDTLSPVVVAVAANVARMTVFNYFPRKEDLMLDRQGTVWVTDFGLAKAEGTEDLTHPGDVVGTVGETGSLKGAYLYFEVRRRGLAVDPMPWVGAAMARAP